jgi:pimeloyl-ACP methyl ester carboxylesterase
LLLCACGAPPAGSREGQDLTTHYRASAGIGQTRASSETKAALKANGWTKLSNADAAARFEAKGDPASLLHASEPRFFSGGKENYFLGARNAWDWLRTAKTGDRNRAYQLYNHNVTGYALAVDWSRSTDRVADSAVTLQRKGLAREKFDQLLLTYSVDTSWLNERVVTKGVGAPVMITFPRTAERDRKWPYLIPDVLACPTTAILRFDGARATLALHDPKQSETIALLGKRMRLKVDYTAPLAYMQSMQRKTAHEMKGEGLSRPDEKFQAIYMVQPTDPTRRVALLVHGWNSSPRIFANLMNSLATDAKLRANYQLVAYRYATGYPLFLCNVMFRDRLQRFYDYLGRVAPAARSAGTIAIGHSMGGLQIKPLAQDSGRVLWKKFFGSSNVSLTSEEGQILQAGLVFKPLPEVRRLVFLAVPHRGTSLASSVLGGIGKDTIAEDPEQTELREDLLDEYGDMMTDEVRTLLKNKLTSVDSLKPSGVYLNLLLELPIHVPYHSIIAKSDGAVPRKSSHLEGAQSEVIVPGGHSVYSREECAAELRRIMLLHLQ